MKKVADRDSDCTIGSDPVYHNVMMELLSGLNSSHVLLLTPTTSGKKGKPYIELPTPWSTSEFNEVFTCNLQDTENE